MRKIYQCFPFWLQYRQKYILNFFRSVMCTFHDSEQMCWAHTLGGKSFTLYASYRWTVILSTMSVALGKHWIQWWNFEENSSLVLIIIVFDTGATSTRQSYFSKVFAQEPEIRATFRLIFRFIFSFAKHTSTRDEEEHVHIFLFSWQKVNCMTSILHCTPSYLTFSHWIIIIPWGDSWNWKNWFSVRQIF